MKLFDRTLWIRSLASVLVLGHGVFFSLSPLYQPGNQSPVFVIAGLLFGLIGLLLFIQAIRINMNGDEP